jgi:ABC-type transport system involved in multi-copper enzyme maturation permease subunit
MNNFLKIATVSKYTFKEILKSKILYSTLIIGFCMIVVTVVAAEFTYGVPERVALDFGLGMLSLSSLGIALFMGAGLLSKEIESRTVYMVISRPIPRWCFIIGKVMGLTAVLTVNILILSFMTLTCSALLGGHLNSAIFFAILFNILEAFLLLLVVVFFSLFSNPILASLISIVVLLSGHAVKETQMTSFAQARPMLQTILKIYHLILPGFYKLNLKDFVIYHQTIEASYLWQAFSYGTLYSCFLLVMIIFLFNKKNLN